MQRTGVSLNEAQQRSVSVTMVLADRLIRVMENTMGHQTQLIRVR